MTCHLCGDTAEVKRRLLREGIRLRTRSESKAAHLASLTPEERAEWSRRALAKRPSNWTDKAIATKRRRGSLPGRSG